MPLVECVPNVSEGRRADVIARLAQTRSRVPGVHLLDQSSDPSHNRTVYTFVGEPQPLQQAVLRLFASAIAHIDLRTHHRRASAHRRRRCRAVRAARRRDDGRLRRRWPDRRPSSSRTLLGCPSICMRRRRISARPAESRRHSPRRARRARAHGCATPAWRPDFGEPQPHPDGRRHGDRRAAHSDRLQREPRTDRLDVARRIASAIRASSGGFAHVQGDGRAAGASRHRAGLDEPDRLPPHVDGDGVRRRRARGGGRRRRGARKRNCGAGAGRRAAAGSGDAVEAVR